MPRRSHRNRPGFAGSPGLPEGVVRALAEFKATVMSLLGDRVREMRLFGSYARGEFREDSDVDVLVLIDRLSWREKVAVLDAAADLSLEWNVNLSPLVMATDQFAFLVACETGLARNILEEGIAA